MCEDKGKIYGIEHIPGLVRKSIENIKKSNGNLLDKKIIEIIEADGRKGYKKFAPYNAIHIGAGIFKYW